VWVGGRLWDQDSCAAFDEVVRSDVCHDLCAWEDLGVELIFQLMELLRTLSQGITIDITVQRTRSS
jgi:hypothetical protein